MQSKNLNSNDLIKEIEEYKKFAFKNNMISIAIAFIIASSFNDVVQSISNNILMPIINYIISQTGEDWRTLKFSPVNGMDLEIGKFLGVFVDFILISTILYILNKGFSVKDERTRAKD